MDGVTTAIFGFIFVCIVMPKLVRSPGAFFVGVAAGLAIVLLNTIATIFTGYAFARVMIVFAGLMQLAAIGFLIRATAGRGWQSMATEVLRGLKIAPAEPSDTEGDPR